MTIFTITYRYVVAKVILENYKQKTREIKGLASTLNFKPVTNDPGLCDPDYQKKNPGFSSGTTFSNVTKIKK